MTALRALLDATWCGGAGALRWLAALGPALAALPDVRWTVLCREEQRAALGPAGAVVLAPPLTRTLAGRMAFGARGLPRVLAQHRSHVLYAPRGIAPPGLPCPAVVDLPVDPGPLPAGAVHSRRWWWERRAALALARQGTGRAARLVAPATCVAGAAARVRVVPPVMPDPGPGGGERDALQLLTLGRIHALRHLPALLEALVLLREHHRVVAPLTVVGAPADVEHARFLRRQAASLGLGTQVSFVGELAAADLGRALRRAAVAVFPGAGTAWLEALGAGVPSVVAECPLAREVCGGAVGYAAAGSPVGLAEALRGLLCDGERRALLAGRALAVAARHTPAAAAHATLAVLREAAS